MATPIGDLVKIQVSEVVNSFGSKTQSKLNATDSVIQVRVSTANNKITLEWDANKKEDVFKYSYKASNTSKDANWTNIASISNGSDKTRKVEITKDSSSQPLTNKTKVEYKIYDSNDQLVASGVVTAKVGKDATTGGSGGAEISGITTGKVLTIEGKKYTVIEQVEGSKYKVLANDLVNNRQYMSFDNGDSNNYAASSIATYLDDNYYNSTELDAIRNAIVDTSIQQKVSSTGTDYGKNSPTWTGETRDAGTHKVFLPSWDELTKVAGSTDKETLKTFLNGEWVWLRDIYNKYVFHVHSNGWIYKTYPNGNYLVCPAFVLDLSKVAYSIVK